MDLLASSARYSCIIYITILGIREKGRDMTQSYDKSPTPEEMSLG